MQHFLFYKPVFIYQDAATRLHYFLPARHNILSFASSVERLKKKSFLALGKDK